MPDTHFVAGQRGKASSSSSANKKDRYEQLIFGNSEMAASVSNAISDAVFRRSIDSLWEEPLMPGNLAEAQEIERQADEVIGIHVRGLAYAELLPHYPYQSA